MSTIISELEGHVHKKGTLLQAKVVSVDQFYSIPLALPMEVIGKWAPEPG